MPTNGASKATGFMNRPSRHCTTVSRMMAKPIRVLPMLPAISR